MARIKRVDIDGLIETADHEGLVPYRYRDSVGIDTFGIGHTKNAGGLNPALIPYGQEQPIELVLETYREDARKFEARVAKHMVTEKQTEFNAGFGFDFNTGAIDRATWVKTHNGGNKALAADQIMNWTKPPEIRERREHEQRLYRDGVYSSDGKVPSWPADTLGRVRWGNGKIVNIRPAMEKLYGANTAANTADKAKTTTQASGVGAGGSAVGSNVPDAMTPEPPASIPDAVSTLDPASIQTLLLIGAFGLAIVAIIAGAIWVANRRKARKLTKSAAESLQKEMVINVSDSRDSRRYLGKGAGPSGPE